MTYQIQNSDLSRTFTIQDNLVDSSSLSLTLIGRNVSNYGQYIARNTIHHLENFANSLAPSYPLTGQLWYDTSLGNTALRVWTGTNWQTPSQLEGITGGGGISTVTAGDGLTGGGSTTTVILDIVAGTGIDVNPNNVAIDTTWLSGYIGSVAGSGGATTLDGLTDVIIASPQVGEVLKYDGTNWVNDVDAGGTGGTITGVFAGTGMTRTVSGTDITLNVIGVNGITANANDVEINTAWVIGYLGTAYSVNGLSDVVITSPAVNEVLKYNGTNWVNSPDATGGGGGSGTVTSVTAGNGLLVGTTDAGSITASGTLNVGAGTGITVSSSAVGVNTTWLAAYISTGLGTGAVANQVLYTNGTGGLSSSSAFKYTPSTNNVTATGNIVASGDVVAFFSDDRLKTREKNIDQALSKVESLNGFYFTNNSTAQALGYTGTQRHVGVSAQEVQSVLPEVVVPAPIDEQYMTVKYEKLVPLLIEAIKELSARVKELEGMLK